MPVANNNEKVPPHQGRSFHDAFQEFLSKQTLHSRFEQEVCSDNEQSEHGRNESFNNCKISSKVKILSDVTVEVGSTFPDITIIPKQIQNPVEGGCKSSPHLSNISSLQPSKVLDILGCPSKIIFALDKIKHNDISLSSALDIKTEKREKIKKTTENEQIVDNMLSKQFQNNIRKDLTSNCANPTFIKFPVPLRENRFPPSLIPVTTPKLKLPALQLEKSTKISQSVLLKSMQNISNFSSAILEKDKKLSALTQVFESDMEDYNHSSPVKEETLEQQLVTPNLSLVSQAAISELKPLVLPSNKYQKDVKERLKLSLQNNLKTYATGKKPNLTGLTLSLPNEDINKKYMISRSLELSKKVNDSDKMSVIQSSISTKPLPQELFKKSHQDNVATFASKKRTCMVSCSSQNVAKKLSSIHSNPNLALMNQAKRAKVDISGGCSGKSTKISQELQRKPLLKNVVVPGPNSISTIPRSLAETSETPMAFTEETNNTENDVLPKKEEKKRVFKELRYTVKKRENDCNILILY